MSPSDYHLILGVLILFPLGVYIAFKLVNTIVEKLFF